MIFSYLISEVLMWRCSHRLSSSLWFGFPKRPPSIDYGIVKLLECFQICGRTCVMWFGCSVFQMTFVRSYSLSPVTRSQVACLYQDPHRLQLRELGVVDETEARYEMVMFESPLLDGIRRIGLRWRVDADK